MSLPKTILVPTDFSEFADHALDYAIMLASKLGAQVHVVHALTIPELGVPELGVALTSTMMGSMVQKNQAALDKLLASHPSANLATMLRTGDPRSVILQAAKELGADLIVMGTHGRRGVSRALLGSIAEAIVRTAPCPVLTVRGRDHQGP
jgi:nucleotide-binding universal stress UspA family protein